MLPVEKALASFTPYVTYWIAVPSFWGNGVCTINVTVLVKRTTYAGTRREIRRALHRQLTDRILMSIACESSEWAHHHVEKVVLVVRIRTDQRPR